MKKGSLYTAFFVFFIDNFGFAIVYPLFGPLLLNSHYGLLPADTSVHMRNVFLSVLFIAYPFGQFFGAPFFGDIADCWGRKKALYFTIGGIMVGYFLSAIALDLRTYWGLVATRLFTGFFAGNMSISFATIADLSPTDKLRTRNFGFNAISAGIAWILAMLVGGDLSNPHLIKFFNPTTPFWITGIFTGLGLIIVAFWFKETHEPQKKAKIDLLRGVKGLRYAFTLLKVRGLYAIYACWTISWMLVVSWLAGISVEKFQLSQTMITWILIGNGLSWMGMNIFSSTYLIKHMSVNTVALVGCLLCGVSLILSMVGGVWLFAWMFIFATGFAGASWTAIMSLISMYTPKQIQGIAMGVGQSVMALGFIFGPLIGGGLINVGLSIPYLFSGSLMLLGFCLLLWWRSAHKIVH